MYLLFPGRHQLLTNFQFHYLSNLLSNGLHGVRKLDGGLLPVGNIDALVFAVTSANHSNTRRNPLPFYLRALAIREFSATLGVPVYIYGVDDVGALPNFATYTLKRIRHESDGQLDMHPGNTAVICSTPVLEMYEQLGFPILPAELVDRTTWRHSTAMPWDVVEKIAAAEAWTEDLYVREHMHASSRSLWEQYRLAFKVQLLFRDTMIGDDGDITTTRDYNTYVRQMDTIAALKYADTAPYIRAGRIGDIGCAVGSWIKLACEDVRLRESDFYGIEVARHLFDICQQRKHNGEFKNPFVFFSQRNAVTGLAFEPASMDTIHTSSLTHEIESYGSREDLLAFIRNRYAELRPGGIWINRDVVGPEEKGQIVLMALATTDGNNANPLTQFSTREELAQHLEKLSTHARFIRFAHDFRRKEGYQLLYEEVTYGDKAYIRLTLADACEFMSRKDYTDNWESEMHETFTFWSFNDWKHALQETGFTVTEASKAYVNDWIVTNRLVGKVTLWTEEGGELKPMAYPVTNMLMLAEKS
jgi:SAM-dependent methyltransferase